jgi:DNA-binding SARP family transcriptional activator/tetratricopeptide (TPR) repeat protein
MPGVSDRAGGIACVRVLGGVEAVTSDGLIVDLPSASQRRLLGLLALHAPRRLRSEWLADVLGVSPGALRTTVSRLRSAIGADALLTASTGYSLACDVDASKFCQAVAAATDSGHRIRALGDALTLWAGPVLDEFSGEQWASGETARLTEIHAGAVEDYGEELISACRATDAVALLEGQIARYPYRDRSRGILIRALALAGRQADALRAFQTYRSLLVDELGTEPSPEVVRTERRVASGWNGLGSEPEPSGLADAVVFPLPAGLAHRVAFVGRATEQDVLSSELELVEATGLRCVLLGGESGIGKTTLLAEFARSVTSSARANVLYGRCDETGVPLEPFRTVLGACVDNAPLDLVTEHVARCGGELARICPRVATRVATAPVPTGSDDTTERFLAFDAAADLLRRIATRRPLVLVLDDLQWAEPTALLLLRHLAGSLGDAPVLFLVSRRDPGEQVSDQLRGALADLERGEVRHLQLTGLDEGELAELVVAATRVAPDPELRRVTARLREETAGNPLYASQLVRHWMELGRAASGLAGEHGRPTIVMPEGVPPSLREVVWSRVHALGDEVFAVLSAASVLGLEFPQDVLVEMLDLPEPAVLQALDVAMAAGVLIDMRSVRRAMRFVHALVANALYNNVGPSSRARMHERAADALAKRDEVVAPDVVVQLARHCALAGLATEALHWSICAGDHAFEHLAPTEAAHHYRVALDAAVVLNRPDTERADLLVRLGDAQHRAGDPHALDTLEQGAELARRSGNNEALIRAAFAANRGFMRLDSGAPAYLAIVEAAVLAADPAETATYSRLLALLAQSLISTPEAERRVALAHEALALAEAADEPNLLAQLAPAVVSALWAPGTGRKRGEVATRALAGAEGSGDPRLQFSAHLASFTVAVESGDPVMAAHSLAKFRSTARTVGEPRLRWIAGLYDTFEATMTARLDDAQAFATANLDLGMQIGAPDAFTFFATQFFVIGTFAGRHEELFPLVEQVTRDNPTVLAFKVAHGIICAAVGRDDVARQILQEGTATGFAQLPVDNIWMTTVIGYAILAIELEDVEAAAELLPMIEPFATEVAFNGVTSQGPVAAYVGKLASLLGRHDQAEDQLQAALSMATAFGWTYHRATTLLALAQARYGRLGALDAEARSWLTEASELCRACGFRSWIARIDELEARSPLQVARP